MKGIALLVLALCAGQAVAAQRPLRVLFIGNSHTYVHDVPGLVETLARGTDRPLRVEMRAQPAWSLTEHLNDRKLRSLLAEPWDWIVLQQGASSRPESRAALIDDAREMARRIKRAQSARRRDALGLVGVAGGPQSAAMRRVGRASEALQGATRVALYSTWPSLAMADSSHDAEESYRLAARAAHACMLPVAAAWRTAIQAGGAPSLYGSDRHHASRAGAVLAALVIATALTGADAPPRLGLPEGATDEEAQRLRRLENAAAAALAAEPLRCTG